MEQFRFTATLRRPDENEEKGEKERGLQRRNEMKRILTI